MLDSYCAESVSFMELNSPSSCIEQLKSYLRTENFSHKTQRLYVSCVRRFLEFLETNSVSIEAANAQHIEDFLRRVLRMRRRKQRGWVPRNVCRWRREYTVPVRQLLRLVHGRWPIPSAPTTLVEVFQCEIVHGFDTWMRDLRGLAPSTRSARTADAQHFLTSLGARGDRGGIYGLRVRDIDVYVRQRCIGLRRQSIKECASNLRVFLRYLHASGYTEFDLSRTVMMPKIYKDESIPAALRPEEVKKILAITRQDISPIGRRDYAILMLLATYGLRGGEILAMRLDDIDWRNEMLRVRHTKTGEHTPLPLLREPGDALLRYLKSARPNSAHREVFLRTVAPIRPFRSVSSLHRLMQPRLEAAGIVRSSKRGPHAFRHARAMSLLRGAVPLKTIGDVLGHRSAQSTSIYLKLATEDLRAVGLEVPTEVSP
jgi:integrase/recombinase XerD